MVAAAYYNNSASHLKQLAANFFCSMDTNRDGLVSFDEFYNFFQQSGYNWIDPPLTPTFSIAWTVTGTVAWISTKSHAVLHNENSWCVVPKLQSLPYGTLFSLASNALTPLPPPTFSVLLVIINGSSATTTLLLTSPSWITTCCYDLREGFR